MFFSGRTDSKDNLIEIYYFGTGSTQKYGSEPRNKNREKKTISFKSKKRHIFELRFLHHFVDLAKMILNIYFLLGFDKIFNTIF